MSSNLSMELEEKDYEFCGHPIRITMFKGASLGVSSYVWGPGVILCRYFEAAKIDFTGKKVLELGSGTGIVGILATLLGRTVDVVYIGFSKALDKAPHVGLVQKIKLNGSHGGDVTLTDRPYVLKQIEYNIVANVPPSHRHRTKTSALAWGSDQDKFQADFDVILGSDIVYSPKQFPGLLQTLQYFCKDKTVIYLCSDVKYREGSAKFHSEMVPEQFNSEIIHTSGSSCVFKLTRKIPGDSTSF